MSIVINKFPQDDQIWELIWFGSVNSARNVNNPKEPLLTVLLQNTTNNNQTILKNVGVGQLPILAIGSQWRNGKRIGHFKDSARNGYIKTHLQLTISEEAITTTKTGAKIDEQKGHFLIPPFSYFFGQEPSIMKEALNAPCLYIPYKGYFTSIIIPMTEVIRFYYCGSTELCRTFFNGDFFREEGALFNRQKSYLQPNGEYVLQLRKEYADDDAWVVARIAADQTAMKGAKQIHKTILSDFVAKKKLYPITIPPFTGKTKLTVWGKEIKYFDGRKNFLVLEIISCSGKFPYKQLTLNRDNPGLNADNRVNEQGSNNFKMGHTPNREIRDDIKISDNQEPDISKRKYTEYLPHLRFIDVKGKEIKKPFNKLVTGTYIRNEITSNEDNVQTPNSSITDNITGSTGISGSGESGVFSTSLVTTSLGAEIYKNKRLASTFSNFCRGVDALEEKENVKCSYEQIIPSPNDEIASLFPAGCSTWATTHHGKRPRQIMICLVVFGRKIFYLLEIEHILKSDSYTTLLFHRNDFADIYRNDLEHALRLCAINNGSWFEDHALGVDKKAHKIKHIWKTPQEFADKVFRIMTNCQ